MDHARRHTRGNNDLNGVRFGQTIDLPEPLEIQLPLPEEVSPDVLNALMAAEDITLFALEAVGKGPSLSGEDTFQGYRVIAEKRSQGAEARSAASSLRTAIIDGSHDALASCFLPAHGLRLQQDGHVFDFVICYACSRVNILRDGQRLNAVAIRGSPDILNEQLRSVLPAS